jgi:purine-binding chemotaxis protein CheW
MTKDTIVAEKQMVLFKLGCETYGLDIATVHEIIRMQPITKVPKTPSYVEGVINLRGKTIPVIDMGKRFGMEKVERDKNNRIVVVNLQDTIMGIVVDSVTEVLSIPTDSIEPVSEVVTTANSDYLAGIAKLADNMVILLELNKLLSGEKH